MTKTKQVTAAELARASHYKPPTITAWTRAGIIKRVNGKFDLAKSLIAIREHEKNRASDGGRERGELSQLRAEKLRRQITLLDVEIEKLRKDSPGGSMPIAELRQAFSLLQLGVRQQLNRYGEHVANDALISGVVALLANDQDRWLHDQIKKDTWSWIAQSDNHITRALILYVECMAFVRGRDVSAEDAATINRIMQRAVEKMASLPPILPQAEYEEKAFREILAKSHQTTARSSVANGSAVKQSGNTQEQPQ